jgi:hypothetical protein
MFSVKNLWSKVIGLTQNTDTPIATLADISALPKQSIAVVDISEAPLVYLKQADNVLDEVDIREEYFRTRLEQWMGEYSLVFPSSDAWGNFWTQWKHLL